MDHFLCNDGIIVNNLVNIDMKIISFKLGFFVKIFEIVIPSDWISYVTLIVSWFIKLIVLMI